MVLSKWTRFYIQVLITTDYNVTGYEFAPNLVWIKTRQAVGGSLLNNLLFDTVRGAGARLISNDTAVEVR